MCEIQEINYEKLNKLLIEYFDYVERLKTIKDVVIVEPKKPSVVEHFSDWDNYRKLYKVYLQEYKHRSDDYECVENNIEFVKTRIRIEIPANTWIKIANMYIGYETNTWPMHVPELQIQFAENSSELRELKHRL